MDNKKFKIILIIILIIVVGGIVLVKLSPPGFTDGIVARGEDNLTTRLGDEFLLKYETRNFPDYETLITIMDKSKKNTFGHYIIEDDYRKPDYIVHINSKDTRCYQIRNTLIYRGNNGQFKGMEVDDIEKEEINNTDLITVSKALVAKKEWVWIRYYGEFLLKAGDEDIKKTLERFAAGKFTKEELNLNKNSEFKKEDMQDFARQLIQGE